MHKYLRMSRSQHCSTHETIFIYSTVLKKDLLSVLWWSSSMSWFHLDKENNLVGRCCNTHYRHISVPDHNKASHNLFARGGSCLQLKGKYLKHHKTKHYKIRYSCTLQNSWFLFWTRVMHEPWPGGSVSLRVVLCTKKIVGSIPSQAIGYKFEQEATNQCLSPSLSLPPFLPAFL